MERKGIITNKRPANQAAKLDFRKPGCRVTTEMPDIRLQVGQRIKALRVARQLSLSDLSRQSGIAKATLSQIESGKANPTLETLWELTRALHVPLGDLVRAEPSDLMVVRASEGAVVRSGPFEARLISEWDEGNTRLELYHCTIERGQHSSPAHAPGVTEHLIVQAGHMRVGPVSQEVELGPGDYLRMSNAGPHRYESLADCSAFTLIMAYPPERLQ